MNIKHHYFLKLGKGNFLFDFFLKKEISPHVIIGHGSWKVEHFNENNDYLEDKYAKKNKQQIEAFFEHRNNKKDSFFWIFHETKIYALQPDSKIYDLTEYLEKNIDQKFTDYCHLEEDWEEYENSKKNKDDKKFHLWATAKLFKAKLAFPPLQYSEVINTFASINANRYHNSKTISELKEGSVLYDIAESIVKIKLLDGKAKSPKNINFEEKLKYLSPTQFETLVFLTLYELGYFPSSYRGGTGKDYDILLYDGDKNISKKLEGKSYISVKLNSSQTHYSLPNEEQSIYVFGINDSKASSKNSINILELIENLEEEKKSRVNKWVNYQISNLLPFGV